MQLLPAWSTNLSSKVVHRPKIHLVDTGLAAALNGFTADSLLGSPERFGALLETFVMMELRKQIGWSQSQPTLWHFRDRGGAEVDIVMEYPDGRIVGVLNQREFGPSPSTKVHHFAALRCVPTIFNRVVDLSTCRRGPISAPLA